MSQNGSSNCLTNWAVCLELVFTMKTTNHALFSCFDSPEESSAEGAGTLHPRRSKRLSFCLPFTDHRERPSLCPVPRVLVNKVWAPSKANPRSLSLATTQGFGGLSLEMSQPTVGEKNCTSKITSDTPSKACPFVYQTWSLTTRDHTSLPLVSLVFH